MSNRRFNIGRQGEQLMNDKLFKAYNRIKYIGNGPGAPEQQYQTPIQDYSLWTDRSNGVDVLKSYNQSKNKWNTLFEGYYHPANLREKPVSPIDGQAYIDNNGVLRYYEDAQWKIASALSTGDSGTDYYGLTNFNLIPFMLPITGYDRNYLIPEIKVGRLFDNKIFLPTTKYNGSGVKLTYPTTSGAQPKEKVSWIHLNPAFLSSTRKRLIKLIDNIKNNGYIINVPVNNTEFYGFKAGNPIGQLLRQQDEFTDIDTISDYKQVSNGIQLVNKGKEYDYIYAITYTFDKMDNNYGFMLTDNIKIGSNSQVFVGQIQGFPLVFLDGLYYEQDQYKYSESEGTLEFLSGSITETMDLCVAAFADIVRDESKGAGKEHQQIPPFEVKMTQANIQSNKDGIVQHEYLKQAAKFKHPIVFAQGIAGMYDEEFGITDEVEIDAATGKVTIKNIGDLGDEAIQILVADIGDAKLSSGYFNNEGCIIDENIKNDCTYLVFADGICTSPSDHEVSEGRIKIPGALESTQYFLMCLDKGDTGIDMIFDASVAYFTAQIDDHDANVVYNDCAMVLAYASSETEGGILIDENFITGEEKVYSTGEIRRFRVGDNDYNYKYKIFNVNGDYQWQEITLDNGLNELTDLVVALNSLGSVSIKSNETLKGKTLTYYAYTYCDQVDEPILSGDRILKYNVEGHINNTKQDFYVNRTHIYNPPNRGILSTYNNGLQILSTDSETVNCKFTVDTPICDGFVKTWGNKADLYNLLKDIDDNTTVQDLINMRNDLYTKELEEYSINTHLLEQLKLLSNALKDAEDGEELTYFVERLEHDEIISAQREIMSWQNRYLNFDNTFTAVQNIGPGMVNLYLNGVLLERTDYSIFDNNNFILKDINVTGGSEEFDLSDESTHRLIRYVIEEENEEGKIEGKFKNVYCEEPDELLVEYLPDTSLKKISYLITDNTYYTNGVLYDEQYQFPDSLIYTKDKIKIYIDGVLYTGKYRMEKRDIILEDLELNEDPIKLYFDLHPDEYKIWKAEHGEYKSENSRIIFEWR